MSTLLKLTCRAAGLCVVLVGLAGCARMPKNLASAGESMDRVALKLEEYGTVTISAPLLARPTTRFAFELNRTPQEFFGEAKSDRQGSAGEFEQVSQSFSGGVSAGFNPLEAIEVRGGTGGSRGGEAARAGARGGDGCPA